MKNLNEAIKCIDQAHDIIVNLSTDYLDLLMEQIELVPDDEEITLSAKTLKSFCRTFCALESYMINDMDGISNYLQAKNLI